MSEEITDFQLVDDPSKLEAFGAQPEAEVEQQAEQPQETPEAFTSQPDQQTQEAPQEAQPAQDEPVFDAFLGRVDDNSGNEQPTQGGQEPHEYSQEEIDAAVTQYLSSKLGRQISSLDDLSSPQRSLDERVETIAKFVEETGRDPFDWFRYQAINPSEMDDMTVLKMDMMTKYPQLSQEEIDLMVSNKYKVNSEFADESAQKMAQLQLKMDAAEARQGIEKMRESYKAPAQQEPQQQSIVDEGWIRDMVTELEEFKGIEFELGEGKSFKFGIDNQYKSELARKNAQIENYFDDYVSDDGRWDYDKLTSHRAILDNIDAIVQSVYRQGLGDGQKGIVDMASNVQSSRPNVSSDVSSDQSLLDQVSPFFNNNLMTFKA